MEQNNIIKHLAVIMDGNGRWAAERGLERSEGHKEGAKRVFDLVDAVRKFDIKYVTLYAFSTENWKRSKEEVDYLMDLLCSFLDANISDLKKQRVRLLALGRIEGLPQKCVERLRKAEAVTAEDYDYTLIIALNYGGRCEIADAAKKIAEKVQAGSLKAEDIDENTVQQNLYLPEIPDPDLLIRTSGEERLSNFLLWQLSYAEFYFTNTYWPDFDENELEKALSAFQNRKRRFGGRK